MESTQDKEVIPTGRNIDQSAKVFGMTRDGLIGWLKSKRKVLDIGAGGGTLEKEFEIIQQNSPESIPTEIYPLDIAYGTRQGIEFSRRLSNLLITEEDMSSGQSENKLQKINSTFESKIIARDFNDLHFANGSFDGVIASYAFAHINDPQKLEKPYEEIYRVLEPGGQALVTVVRNIIPVHLSFDIGETHTSGKHSFVVFSKPV